MDNRHLYRGKRLDNREWVYGNYTLIKFRDINPSNPITKEIKPEWQYNEKCRKINEGRDYWAAIQSRNNPASIKEVDPATVSQCTGLIAAKSYRGEREEDRLIFEGDIIRRTGEDAACFSPGTIHWSDERTKYIIVYGSGHIRHLNGIWGIQGMEIIGNIHDNLELVEVDND